MALHDLSIEDFKPITLEDKPMFDEHYLKFPPFHSDNLFSTMISWKDYGDYHYTFIKEILPLGFYSIKGP